MPSSTQLAFIATVATATLVFVVAGAIVGRVTIGRANLDAVMGTRTGRVPQIVIAGPVMVLGTTAILWLAAVSLLAGALAIVAVFVVARVLELRQPHADVLRERRSRLNAGIARHPASTNALRALLVAYVTAVVIAALAINPRP